MVDLDQARGPIVLEFSVIYELPSQWWRPGRFSSGNSPKAIQILLSASLLNTRTGGELHAYPDNRDLKSSLPWVFAGTAGLASASHVLESGGEVANEVFGIFNADRVADQVVFDPDHEAFLSRQFIKAH